MLIVSIFAVGLLGGSLGVFSLVVLEIVVCCVAFAGFWNEGLVRACWKSLEMGAIVTAGFNCALIAQYVCAKFRFWRMTIRQRDDVGFFYVAAGREAEPVRFFLRHSRTDPRKSS